MFSSSNIFIMLSGVILALFTIFCSLYFVNKLLIKDTQEVLVRFILLVFTALVSVWIVDKIIAFRINLLNDEQDSSLFDLIKTLILMIFSYYFGTNTKTKKD